jgi:hypothetical protein
MRQARWLTGLALLAAAAVVPLAGCQNDSPLPPIVVVTPQPVRGVIAQTSFSGFETDIWVSIEILVSQRGVLDVTVDWTSPDAWIYVYFGQTSCDYAQLAKHTCPFLISSETKTPKPRILTTGTIEPGKYYLVLYNVPRNPATGIGSDATESVSLQVGLTVSASGQRATDVVHLGRPTVVPAPRL